MYFSKQKNRFDLRFFSVLAISKVSFFIFTKLQSLHTISTSKANLTPLTTTPTQIPVGKPTTISIPATGVNTTVKSVGMGYQIKMGVS